MSKSIYTESMVARMVAAAPLNSEKAAALAEEFGTVNTRSVIAKAKSEGIEYVTKAKPAAKKAAPSKSDVVDEIVALVGSDENSEVLGRLVVAPMVSLVAFRDAVAAKVEC